MKDNVEKAIIAGYAKLERRHHEHLTKDTIRGGVARALSANEAFELAFYREKRRSMARGIPANDVTAIGSAVIGGMVAHIVRNLFDPKDQQDALYRVLNKIGEAAAQSINNAADRVAAGDTSRQSEPGGGTA